MQPLRREFTLRYAMGVLVAALWVSDVAAESRVMVVRFENEAITPVTARFLARTLDAAGVEGVECVVVVLDTPGGLVASTRAVVKDILASPVPVVVYVAPPGSRAASAGVFIAMAAHVSAMAPGTTIGAAHPVALGGLPVPTPRREETTEQQGDAEAADGSRRGTPETAKAVNDTVAWARALAELRGRNADWVERAVRESEAVPAATAVAEGAVDLLAADLPALLEQMEGREVALRTGPRRLRTAGATVAIRTMWWGEQMLAVLASPNLAVLLLVLGFYGVLFELYSPGWGVAGTLGAICLAFSFFSLAFLPVRFAGLLLLLLAFAMFVAEVVITSYGTLSLGGAVCLVLGGLMLVESPAGFAGVSLNLLLPFAVATAVVTLALMAGIVTAHRRPVVTGVDAHRGALAVADGDFRSSTSGHVGAVRMHGELWRATSVEPVVAGTRLEVIDRNGLTLRVRTAAVADSSTSPGA